MSFRWREISQRIYRGLLRAYPADFRDEFGGQMDQDFRSRLDRRSAGTVWFETITDWLTSMPREQWDLTRQDVRFACRTLARSSLFTVVVVACLAVGIGANTAIFSFTDHFLLQSPVPGDTRNLVGIGRVNAQSEPSSWLDYLDYRDRNQAFSRLAAFEAMPVAFGSGRRSDIVMAEAVTDNYFSTLGLVPAVGRLFAPGECPRDCPPEVILSYRLWQQQYGGDPAIVGRQIPQDGIPATVIGVAPEGYYGASLPIAVELWIHVTAVRASAPRLFTDREARWLVMAGRLKPGISVRQAQTNLNLIDEQMRKEYRYSEQQGRGLVVSPIRGVWVPLIRQRIQMVMTMIMAVVGLVLLIACANVANLVLARATARQREIGVRLALGASHYRLVRQQLTESVLLSLLGGAAGLLVGRWLSTVLLRLQPPATGIFIYRLEANQDTRVWVFTFTLSVLSSVLFGLLPAWRAARADGNTAIKGIGETKPGRFAARHALVVSQVALSLVLLVTTGMLLRSLREVQTIHPGFATENGLVVPLNLNLATYRGRDDKGRQFCRAMQERVRALPGVQAMTLASYIPLNAFDPTILVEHDGVEPRRVGIDTIEPDYLDLMNVPLLHGRNFSPQDTPNSPAVVLVDEMLAHQVWPGRDPVGSTLRLGRQKRTVQVVGVVRASAGRSVTDPPRPTVYIPYSQEYSWDMNLIVRTRGDPAALIDPVRREIERLDDTVPSHGIRTLETQVSNALWLNRIGTQVVSGFGLLALLLAAVGIYGVIAYTFSRRTREIGIRVALGARANEISRLVIRQGLRLTLTGIAVGAVLAVLAGRALARQLYGVSALDPWVYGAVALLWLAVALLASWLPARRAAKVQPQIALRYE